MTRRRHAHVDAPAARGAPHEYDTTKATMTAGRNRSDVESGN